MIRNNLHKELAMISDKLSDELQSKLPFVIGNVIVYFPWWNLTHSLLLKLKR